MAEPVPFQPSDDRPSGDATDPAYDRQGPKETLPSRTGPSKTAPSKTVRDPRQPVGVMDSFDGVLRLDESPAKKRRRRRVFSPLVRRLLMVNLIAVALLFAGFLYLEEYQNGLIQAEIESLRIQGELFAATLGAAAVTARSADVRELSALTVQRLLRWHTRPIKARLRVFAPNGTAMADTRVVEGPGAEILVEKLPPPIQDDSLFGLLLDAWTRINRYLPKWETGETVSGESPVGFGLPAPDPADLFVNIRKTLDGEVMSLVQKTPDGTLSIHVAVPVQPYKQVLGTLLLTSDGSNVVNALRSMRIEVLKLLTLALTGTVLISIYLAGAVARPVSRLAHAADEVRYGAGRRLTIPDLSQRDDEIGDLSVALREMTAALWRRLDAIERFAADVSHEIKNPLTSLRSAVETAYRLRDPERQGRLLAIIQDDVRRIDRLITDISDASRLDAELSRAEFTPVDLMAMLATLLDVCRTTHSKTPMTLVGPENGPEPIVSGMESRLVQVFRNLLSNAHSFSPPGGTIRIILNWISVAKDINGVEIRVEDDGPGLPDGKLEAIFDRFYTERPRGEKFGTHSGLGLSISKQIVETHGGIIRAENRRHPDGRVAGARFILILPLTQ